MYLIGKQIFRLVCLSGLQWQKKICPMGYSSLQKDILAIQVDILRDKLFRSADYPKIL